MAKKSKELPAELAEVFSQAEENREVTVVETPKTVRPAMCSPEWQDYVMGCFAPEELKDGKPLVNAIQRVCEELMGPIVYSVPHTVQAPGWDGDRPIPAVVEWQIRVIADLGGRPQDMVAGDVADCSPENCDKNFAIYPSAMAATRARGRALRNMLRLKTCSAEEVMKGAFDEGEFITRSRIEAINMLCQRQNINVKSLVNMGSCKYNKISEVPKDKAEKMVELLNRYLRGDKIPEAILGYKENWEESF